MSDIRSQTLDLVLDLQNASKDASTIKKYKNNIKRMIKRTIAEYAEDRLAEFLYEAIGDKDIEIFINGSIGKIRPDILIIKNKRIIGIVEVKINFGWCRNIFDPVKSNGRRVYKDKSYLYDRIKVLKKLRKSPIEFDDGEKHEEKNYVTIDKRCKMSIVSTSLENYRGKDISMIDDYEDLIRRKPEFKEEIDFYVMVNKYHNHDKNDDKKWVDKKELRDSIDNLFETKYGMNKLVDSIKKRL